MTIKKRCVSLIFILALKLVTQVVELEAGCCRSCIFYCCSRGPCNAICCNCEYHVPLCLADRDCGCVGWPEWPYAGGNKFSFAGQGGQVSRPDDRIVARQKFQEIDKDGNRKLSIYETTHFFAGKGVDTRELFSNTTWWDKMDLNSDGFIEPAEFDFILMGLELLFRIRLYRS